MYQTHALSADTAVASELSGEATMSTVTYCDFCEGKSVSHHTGIRPMSKITLGEPNGEPNGLGYLHGERDYDICYDCVTKLHEQRMRRPAVR